MNDAPDTGGFSASPDLADAESAVAWQTEQFPQVATSFGGGGEGFLSVAEAWRVDAVAWLDDCLDYQSRFAMGMDDRTRGAHLIAFYCHHLSIAAGVIYLQSGLLPDLDPHRLSVRFEPCEPTSPHSQPDTRRFHFRFDRVLPKAADEGFHDAFVGSLTPVVEALQARTGLSAAAQWRLAADGITGAFLEIGLACGDEERAMASALAIVKRPGSPLLSRELHYERIEAQVDGLLIERVFRLRSGCCLFYRTQGGEFCDVCVSLDPDVQRSRLRDHLVRAGNP